MKPFDFDRHHARMRRTGIVFTVVWWTIFIGIIGSGIWILANPEQIGAFVGRIWTGFKSVHS